MSHDEFREYDAAYVLGSLSPAERRAFEGHLRDCPECAAAVREIAGVPGLLATVPRALAEAELGGHGAVPDTLLPRLVREVRRRRARRGLATGLAAAAAAGLLTLGGVGLAGGLGHESAGVGTAQGPATPSATSPSPGGSPGAGVPVAMRQLGQDRLNATVVFTPKKWGTGVDLTCAYASRAGYPGGDRPEYSLVVRRADGTTQQVATWRAVPGQEMALEGASSWNRADITAVEVRTATGTPVLRLAS